MGGVMQARVGHRLLVVHPDKGKSRSPMRWNRGIDSELALRLGTQHIDNCHRTHEHWFHAATGCVVVLILHKKSMPTLWSLSRDGESTFCYCTLPFLDRPLHVINTVHAHHLQASCVLYLSDAKLIYIINIDSIHGVRTKARKKNRGRWNRPWFCCRWEVQVLPVKDKGTVYGWNSISKGGGKEAVPVSELIGSYYVIFRSLGSNWCLLPSSTIGKSLLLMKSLSHREHPPYPPMWAGLNCSSKVSPV